MKSKDVLYLASAVAVIAGVVAAKKGSDFVSDIFTEELNPASSGNFIYDNIIGGIGRAVSDNPEWDLGTWIYDVTH